MPLVFAILVVLIGISVVSSGVLMFIVGLRTRSADMDIRFVLSLIGLFATFAGIGFVALPFIN